jgi:hypothetical protein
VHHDRSLDDCIDSETYSEAVIDVGIAQAFTRQRFRLLRLPAR